MLCCRTQKEIKSAGSEALVRIGQRNIYGNEKNKSTKDCYSVIIDLITIKKHCLLLLEDRIPNCRSRRCPS